NDIATKKRNASSGGLVGDVQQGTVEACRVNVSLVALDSPSDHYYSFGGIAGTIAQTSDSTIIDCVSSMTLSLPDGMDLGRVGAGAPFATGKQCALKNSIVRADLGGALGFSGTIASRRSTCWIETNFKAESEGNYVLQSPKYTYYGTLTDNPVEMTEEQMKDPAFATTLNTKAASTIGLSNPLTWSIDENENDGFPNLADAGVVAAQVTYYLVTFMAQGTVYKSVSIESGKKVAKPSNPPAPSEDATFLYWYKDDPSVAYDFSTPVTDNLTLTAKWQGQEFTVRFNTNGGSYVYPQTVENGETLSEPVTVRKGYTFAGWYKDADCTEPWNFNTEVTSSMTLYAKWDLPTSEAAVSGRITDADTGDGIRNATVSLSSGRNALTDEFGYYRIQDVPAGKYTITASAFGYNDASQENFTIGTTSVGYDAALTPKDGGGGGGGAATANIYATISCVYSGIMLDGVEIKAVGDGNLGTYSTYTANGGQATFTDLPAGQYTFHINEAGRPGWESYVSAKKSIEGEHQLNCALKPNYQSLKVNVIGTFDPKTNKADMPLAGKEVTLIGVDPADEDNELIHIPAHTGNDGSVTVEKLVPITWKISSSDFAYEEDEVTVTSDGAGKLSEKEVTLTLPFIDSSLSVDLTSIYNDPDLFKRTEENKDTLPDVTLAGVSGTMTEGITRSGKPDASGKVVFTGLFPGNYNLSANGRVMRAVDIISKADQKEIFGDPNDGSFSRFGRKHFDVDFHGAGTGAVALGMRTNATIEMDPAPVSFSGILYKTDMDENGEISSEPLKNAKLIIKPSAYYPQSGAAENGYEITTDDSGHYSITMAPGLYGVEMESSYDGYFGGKLIYHEGNSDGYQGPWGWPCTGEWTGTKASAVAWMTGDDSLAYGDIGGMSLSSGTVVADLEIMEKKINYSACSPGNTVVYDNLTKYNLIIGSERDEEITDDNRTTNWNKYDYYNNTYQAVNYHPDTNGATLKLTGKTQQTVTMTGKTFPYVFYDLAPGDYGLDYQISDAFSELKSSVTWGGQITFFDFPAPGKLPASFPEDYAENNNPWPLSTQYSGLKIEAKSGKQTFSDVCDAMRFKFYNLNVYEKTSNPAQPEKPQGAQAVYGTFNGVPSSQWEAYQEAYADRDLHWRSDAGEEGELDEAVYNDGAMPMLQDYYKLESSGSSIVYGSEVYKPTACSYPAEPEISPQGENESDEAYYARTKPIMDQYHEDIQAFHDALTEAKNQYAEDYASWYQKAYINKGFPKAGSLYVTPEEDGFWDAYYNNNTSAFFKEYLVGYSTSKIPDKLFYYYYNGNQRNKPLPDGKVTLYFCAPKGKGYAFLNYLQNIDNIKRYEELYDSDFWFSVELPDNSNGTIDCDVNFLHPDESTSNVHILSKEEIKHLLNPRTIAVKAVEKDNKNNILNKVDVTITYADREFSSASPTPEQTCFGDVSKVELAADEYEWEYNNSDSVVSTYDDGTKTETFYVPLRKIQYSKQFLIKDDAGNPIDNASLTLTGTSVGQPITLFTGSDGKATAYDWLTYQDYDVHVTCPGYSFHNITLTAEDVRSDEVKTDVLRRDMQPEFDEEGISINRKGAFLPGVNFSGSSNSIDFLIDTAITNAKDKPLYYTVNAKLKTAPGDSLLDVFLIDKRSFRNADFGDRPEALVTPAMDETNYNPSQAWQWGVKLEKGELGNVYYRRFSGGEPFVPTKEQGMWKYYEIEKTLPLWELPPDGFEPCLLAVTSNHAMQIYDFDFTGEAEDEQLVGIRLDGDKAGMLNNITILANAQALGGPAVEKLEELTEPAGSIIPLPSFEAGIEEEDGYLSYDYTMEMQLLQGKKSVSDAEKSYMAILPSTLGIMAKGGWKMGVDGEERKVTNSFHVTVAGKDMDALDYLPSAFEALPVKVEFDEDNPPSGTITLAAADTKDKNNNNTESEYSLGVNGQVHIVAEVSAFSSFAAVLPVGPVLASLEKSGALDIGAKVQVAVGADGTYKYKIINGEEQESEHELEFTLGAGAGLGFYAKAFGGALGAEANLKLTGDNDKLQDMVTV
ncbi:MAG: carboxypeptidase regulatory-like domain-containing protein, partial [Lachnospiraceae bacterium]|nr:carboxypeptidase regulatory-like domain-containing protein [Lachnospiraceae bacterium]